MTPPDDLIKRLEVVIKELRETGLMLAAKDVREAAEQLRLARARIGELESALTQIAECKHTASYIIELSSGASTSRQKRR